MKIASGIYKGKSLIVPKSGIKPTTDKVRQAVMNILQNKLKHSRFLDLFCGTGAIGIEALSNGAGFVCFVESAGKAYSILKNNLESIVQDKSSYRTIKHNVTQLDNEILGDKLFDIVFADPFYIDLKPYFDEIFQIALSCLKEGGIFIAEHSSRDDLSYYPFFKEQKDYGDTRLSIFRKNLEASL